MKTCTIYGAIAYDHTTMPHGVIYWYASRESRAEGHPQPAHYIVRTLEDDDEIGAWLWLERLVEHGRYANEHVWCEEPGVELEIRSY
jgi:hypothetical protein